MGGGGGGKMLERQNGLPRLQCLQCFDFTFKYRPGHWNPIDVFFQGNPFLLVMLK